MTNSNIFLLSIESNNVWLKEAMQKLSALPLFFTT